MPKTQSHRIVPPGVPTDLASRIAGIDHASSQRTGPFAPPLLRLIRSGLGAADCTLTQ